MEREKLIEAAIVRAKNQDKKIKSAQDSIPFERMWPDGICRVTPGYFTKTVQFQDINYQPALQEDKTEIFEEWCSFLNFFDRSFRFRFNSSWLSRFFGLFFKFVYGVIFVCIHYAKA